VIKEAWVPRKCQGDRHQRAVSILHASSWRRHLARRSEAPEL